MIHLLLPRSLGRPIQEDWGAILRPSSIAVQPSHPRDRSVKSFWLARVQIGEIASLFEDLKTIVTLGVNKKTGYYVKVEIQESTLKNTIFFSDQSL